MLPRLLAVVRGPGAACEEILYIRSSGRSVGPPSYDAPVASKRNRSRKSNAPAGPKLAYELFSELNATFYEDDPSEYLLVKIEAVTLMLAPTSSRSVQPSRRASSKLDASAEASVFMRARAAVSTRPQASPMTLDLVDHHRGSADKYSWTPPSDWSIAYENERWWDGVRYYMEDPWFVQVVENGVEVAPECDTLSRRWSRELAVLRSLVRLSS